MQTAPKTRHMVPISSVYWCADCRYKHSSYCCNALNWRLCTGRCLETLWPSTLQYQYANLLFSPALSLDPRVSTQSVAQWLLIPKSPLNTQRPTSAAYAYLPSVIHLLLIKPILHSENKPIAQFTVSNIGLLRNIGTEIRDSSNERLVCRNISPLLLPSQLW
jgi:hypothetical protein